MARIISTRLSSAEHDALIEMVNLRGQNIYEYVRELVLDDLCGTSEAKFKFTESNKSDPIANKIKALMQNNRARFGRKTLGDMIEDAFREKSAELHS